jgi:hypothetical protein
MRIDIEKASPNLGRERAQRYTGLLTGAQSYMYQAWELALCKLHARRDLVSSSSSKT